MTPWHKQPIVVVDFETTGVDPNDCAPVEMALVRFEDGKRIRSWSQRFNPGRPISPEATAVHGITDADVARAMPLRGLTLSLQLSAGWAAAMCDGAVPCAYNHHFDRTILARFCPGLDLVTKWPVWLDPLPVVRLVDKYVKGQGRHQLAATCERHGIELSKTHSARADAEACGKLLFSPKIRRVLGDWPIERVLETQVSRAEQQDREFRKWLEAQGAAK